MEVPYWLDQQPIKQLHWLNPYQRVEAETMNWGYGLKSAKMGIPNTGVVKDMPESTGKRNMYIFDINDGEYIRLRGVDFGKAVQHRRRRCCPSRLYCYPTTRQCEGRCYWNGSHQKHWIC